MKGSEYESGIRQNAKMMESVKEAIAVRSLIDIVNLAPGVLGETQQKHELN